MESDSRAQTITGAHYQASFARFGSATMTFHGRRNTMLIDEAWTLWLGLLSIFSLHVLPRTIMLPSSTSTKLSKLLVSNALWCRLFSVALNHKSVLVPSFPNPGLAPVLLKTVPSLLSCSTCWLPCSDPLLLPNFSPAGSFACQLPC